MRAITDYVESFRGGASVCSVIEDTLANIEEKNVSLNAIISLHDRANLIVESEAADERWEQVRQGKAEPRLLEGVPVILKDNIAVHGELTTAGSKILEGFRPAYDATIVQKLRAAGAIILGKANMDEFAMGSSTEHSAYGPTKNPHDESRVPGGSSGGSAAAVAAGFAPVAIGSDTGGSIRQPASFCGVVGFKPSYGRVSRYGLLAMASSLDQIGPFTNSVEDAARVTEALIGQDPLDATSRAWSDDLVGFSSDLSVGESVRIAAFDGPLDLTGIDPNVRNRISELRAGFADSLNTTVGTFDEIIGANAANDFLDLALDTYYILVPAEVSSNLARFDGIRFGIHPESATLRDVYLSARSTGFGEEVKRRIMLGTHVLSSGYFDAYYKTALKARAYVTEEFNRAFSNADVLMGPTSPTVAFKLGERMDDPLAMYLADLYTIPANIGGLCAINVPCGTVDGMPVGMHIMAKAGNERKLLSVAKSFESFAKGK